MSETEYMIGRDCGITYAGIKPASLICVKKSEYRGMKNISDMFEDRGFRTVPIKVNPKRVVVLVYNERALREILFSDEVKNFLSGYGYRYCKVDEAIKYLKFRMKKEDFPHEIGIFLGYPLADVEGFINSPYDGVKVSGYWKVYSDVKSAQSTFERFRRCSERICEKMKGGESLARIFNVG